MLGEDDTLDRLSRSERQTARIEPLDDHLVIEPTDDDHETRTGLIIPASSEISASSPLKTSAGALNDRRFVIHAPVTIQKRESIAVGAAIHAYHRRHNGRTAA